MKRNSNLKRFNVEKYLFSIFLLIVISAYFSVGQCKQSTEDTLHNLELLSDSIRQVSDQISSTQQLFQSANGIGREQELRQQIDELSQKLKDFETNFVKLATNVDPNVFQPEQKKNTDWYAEANELLNPLITEIKKITAPRREALQLEVDVEKYKTQLQVSKQGLDNIKQLLPQVTRPQLTEKLNYVKVLWENRVNEIQTRINIALQQLEQKRFTRKSFLEHFEEITQIFFKSRGRNFILATITFVVSLFLLSQLHRLIKIYSPLHRRKQRSFYVRSFDMIYRFLTVIVSLLSLLGMLYLLGDWFLLSIVIIFILGISWASSRTVPLVWQQIKLILNLGTVREGELVVYNGIPYEVTSINISSVFINRALAGGKIILPLKDMTNLRSRKIIDGERWFPCVVGDWVKLNDGVYGRVLIQTPEIVELEIGGKSRVTYRTTDFLNKNPTNLSYGFLAVSTLYLDHSNSDNIVSKAPALIKQALELDIKENGLVDIIKSVKVEFEKATIISLDIIVLVEFDAKACENYYAYKRLIQRLCIEICKKNDIKLAYQNIKLDIDKELLIK